MACPQCAPSPEVCVTVYPTLNPCECDSPGGIEEIGPAPVNPGPKGETPIYSVGTVGAGSALISVANTGYATFNVNWVLPAIPEGVPYTWTKINTFDQPSIFQEGIETTGGTTTFGGHAFHVIPNATFSSDLSVGISGSVFGNETVGGNVSIAGNFQVMGAVTLGAVTQNHNLKFGANATITVPTDTNYVRGRLVLDSCDRPVIVYGKGATPYVKADATGLTHVAANSIGTLADPMVVTLSSSTCGPDINPNVDFYLRVSFRNTDSGSGYDPNGTWTLRLWTPVVGGSLLDSVEVTDGGTSIIPRTGTVLMRVRVPLGVGANDFVVDVWNQNLVDFFTPEQITYWVEN